MKKGGAIVLSLGVIVMFGIVATAMWRQEAGGEEESGVIPAASGVQNQEILKAAEPLSNVSPPPAEPAASLEPDPAPPTVLNFKTEKILPVGANSADLSFWIRDVNGDVDAIMIETTEFFYKSGKTNVYTPEFRALADIPELTCTGTKEMSCAYHTTFVGELGWRDVFSGRIQARDAGGRVSKVIPFHIAIGTVQ